jgi:hypothetical protein
MFFKKFRFIRKPNIFQLQFIEILLTPAKLMICSKFAPKLTGARRTISCHIWNLKIAEIIAESSRPRELPPQSLTEPDVNLSAHPAPIDQSLAASIASEQTNSARDVQYTPANTLLASDVHAAFYISSLPNV